MVATLTLGRTAALAMDDGDLVARHPDDHQPGEQGLCLELHKGLSAASTRRS
jgi:hypothetical protein